ncbi:MAG TPA: NYN domain-containing protein [Alphaproteobacteria bacterium]|nr:NYN domain-containing protein [Alphaproteobacteria bacterium]
MNFYPQERIGIFIDGSNLYSAARALNFDIDYKRLLEYFSSEGRLIRAFYYTALFDDQEYSPIRPLVDWLDYNGYTMVTKPTKEFTDAQGRRKIKGNMDIELAVDVLEMADNLDHIVIFSGDGDFRRLVEVVQRKGVRVTVVSTVRSQPPMAADELRRQADYFIELKDIQSQIGRRGGGPVGEPVAEPDYQDDFDEADAEPAAEAPAATPANPDPHPDPAR